MSDKLDYILPKPIINAKEENFLDELTSRYEKLLEPSMVAKAGEKISDVIPNRVKEAGKFAKDIITEQELYLQAMKIVAKGFMAVEEQAAKFAVSEKTIVKKVNAIILNNEITQLDEVCLARGYDLSKVVNKYKTQDFWTAFAEGGVTGAFGFWGIPFNIVLSTFLFYHAVQSIAMYYGYDIKNDTSELVIASEVFMSSLSPASNDLNEMSGIIGKVMLISKATAVG